MSEKISFVIIPYPQRARAKRERKKYTWQGKALLSKTKVSVRGYTGETKTYPSAQTNIVHH